ncbi:ankyrin-3-like [Trichogramma pretiosum]|uniref:ankyrin-3-like n=1 Tax=Trichogramma pretiosum TaxID=7493 RepID=UPI0006C9751A|nr:ankyrin-3-like [Trichogramma pretiosum]
MFGQIRFIYDDIMDSDFEPNDRFVHVPTKLDQLKNLLEGSRWGCAFDRHVFLRQLNPVLNEWNGQFPNLRDIFSPEQIEHLLSETRNYYYMEHRNSNERNEFIRFVIRCGYKDEPDLDKNGRPSLVRTTPIHLAARDGDYDTIPDLFKIYSSFDLNYIDEYTGMTHFEIASMTFCKDAIEKFLEFGNDPNITLPMTGEPLLHAALKKKEREIVEILLRKGANPNLADKSGYRALHIICQDNSDDVHSAKMLFELSQKYHPLLVDAQDEFGDSALHLALRYGNNKLVEFLLKIGADSSLVNKNGLTPRYSTSGGHRELMKVLRTTNELTNVSNCNNKRPLRAKRAPKRLHYIAGYIQLLR